MLMQLWDFEMWLRDLLVASDGIKSAEGFTAATGLLYGVALESTSGARVLIHLTRGSGPVDRRDLPPEHLARVAELDGVPEPALKPLPDETAAKVEQLLRVAIERAAHPDIVYVQTFHERQQERRTRGGSAQRGLVVRFRSEAECYLTLRSA
jgi:hypothetical protein